MKVFRTIDEIRGQIINGVVCVGSFDGVHRGHLELIQRMNKRAKEINGVSIVVTFDPHPRFVLKGENRLIMGLDERLKLLKEAGVDCVFVIEFTKEFSRTSYEDFVQKYLIDAVGARAVFCADGHFFGRDKEGTGEKLKDFGLEVHKIERVGGFSSTAVREAIERGDLHRAKEILGRDVAEEEIIFCKNTK